jgi:hypothetical protein
VALPCDERRASCPPRLISVQPSARATNPGLFFATFPLTYPLDGYGYDRARFKAASIWRRTPLGDKPVRYIYIDEAGTQPRDKCTIVCGVIAHADDHVMLADEAVNEALGAVPAQLRDDPSFVFHALSVWNDPKYRDCWSMTDRLALLKKMMALPRRIGMALSLGITWRSSGRTDLEDHMSREQSHHLQSFIHCVERSDKYIREHAGLREVGSIVAEDCPQMRKYLKKVPTILRRFPYLVTSDMLVATEQERQQGFLRQEGDCRVTRIRQPIYFAEKRDDPLLVLADACAFGFSRFFAELQFGGDFCQAILGHDLLLDDFRGPTSAASWWWP